MASGSRRTEMALAETSVEISNRTLLDQFGPATLWSPLTQEKKAAATILKNKVVLLYFSAAYCSPCQKFTPTLADLCNTLKLKYECEEFEVVFLSMDHFLSQFETYAQTKMSCGIWCLYNDSIVSSLYKTYQAQGIPHLTVIDRSGEVIVQDAVETLQCDPTGRHFPWRPRPLADLLPPQYYNKAGECLPTSDLHGKYLLLYFAAQWSDPCRQFTPKLTKAYEKLKACGRSLECWFISADDTEQEYADCFNGMDFATIGYITRDDDGNAADNGSPAYTTECVRKTLMERLQLSAYPSLVMLSPCEANNDRSVVSTQVQHFIEEGDYISDFPFRPRPYGDLNEVHMATLNEHQCVIVFCEGMDDDEQEDVRECLQMAATSTNKTRNGSSEGQEDALMHYLWATNVSHMSQSMRIALQRPQILASPLLVLLDMKNRCYHLWHDDDEMKKQNVGQSDHYDEITLELIESFVAQPGLRRTLE